MHEDAISLHFVWSLAGVLGLSLMATGCGKYSFSALAAKKSIKEAHEPTRRPSGRRRPQKYEAAVNGDPSLRGAHFFLANSYDNLYKPSRAGEPENDAYMKKAIEWYKKAAENEPDPIYKQRRCSISSPPTGPKSSTSLTRPSPSSSA